MIHPKLFYYPTQRTSISVGYNGAFDHRRGGDMQVLLHEADSMHRYYESNLTQRHTGELLAEHSFLNNTKLTIKGNLSSFDRTNENDRYKTDGNQLSYYSEASVLVPVKNNSLVAGVNAVGDQYRTTYPDTASLKSYTNATIGAFGQFDLNIKEHTTIEAGLRYDYHNRYGAFLLPRIAIFHRFDTHWAARAGFGMGYKTPNPLAQQNIEYSILDLLPPADHVTPELSYGYNAEVNYKADIADNTSIFVNQAFFLTQIDKSVLFNTDNSGKIYLQNASAPVVSRGFDTYVKLDTKTWEFYLGYTFTDARNTYLSSSAFIPLTPKNRFAFVVVKELSDKLRAGLEGSYTGKQFRYDGSRTPDYFFMAAMVQYQLSKEFTIVLNGENLLDYRMSNVEPLFTGSISNPAFKPLWAPIDGRVINLSVRWKLN